MPSIIDLQARVEPDRQTNRRKATLTQCNASVYSDAWKSATVEICARHFKEF